MPDAGCRMQQNRKITRFNVKRYLISGI